MNKTENKNLISMKQRSFLFSVFYLIIFFAPLLSYSQKKVEIVNANILKFDKDLGNGAKRLIGNVQFRQENTVMFCDSAYFYSNNALDAFGHVHIQQDDSVHLYGDLLKYDGNTKKALLTKNVVVNKGDMQLTTDQLNYDLSTSIGYYTTPAKIINKENVLTSTTGYFFSKTNDLTFKKNVVLTNPQFVINCDTMRYNSSSKVTYFLGPTTIKSKENLIYCEDGWYNTATDQSRFSKNSYIITKEQKMFGDSLYYDRKKGIGRAIKNVQLIDTTQKITITGEYAIHYELKDLSIVTGNTLLTQMYEKDTLYLHADTLKAIGSTKEKNYEESRIKNQESGIKKQDSGNKNQNNKPITNNKQLTTNNRQLATDTNQTSNNKRLFAYHKVKFFKHDIQGKCDSLVYEINDSTMKLYGQPTLWSQENQLTGDSMRVLTGSKSIRAIEIQGTGFIVSQEDSLHYNQIRGKYIKGFFKNNEMYRINVVGNGQTIYYAKDKAAEKEKEEIKAVNRADCSDLNIFLKDKKVEHITFLTKPDATLYPLDKIELKDLKLKDFIWRAESRPLTQKDIFIWQ
ncbi:MAG: hypothetical protein A3F72_05180 [Bacteroidetes bacterium RIFCSPLOWO2_12_FULL_35_15]|nr:MAG: hypothetical protein A3F72_05180 [Bacteroidetes bacterium RIFCSPLOWO2_12_FULL_35_15]